MVRSETLVDQGRVREAIAQDDRAGRHGRPHHPLHVVVARGLEEEDLAQPVRLERRVEEHRPHRLGQRRTARLPRMHRAVAQGTQPVVKQPKLGTLTRPLPTLKGNEPTLCHGREYSRPAT